MFTEKLAALCAENGVTFRFNTTITSINTSTQSHRQRVNRDRRTDGGRLCCGLRQLFAIPVAADRGAYSGLSGKGLFHHRPDRRQADAAPVSTIMDETYKVAITRLGDRIRAGGTAEISGYDLNFARCAAGDTATFGRRSVSRRRRSQQGDFLDGLAADDAGWSADHWRRARNIRISTSTPGTARLAGQCPAALAACWPI